LPRAFCTRLSPFALFSRLRAGEASSLEFIDFFYIEIYFAGEIDRAAMNDPFFLRPNNNKRKDANRGGAPVRLSRASLRLPL